MKLRQDNRCTGAFTLVEVLLAVMIASVIAIVALGAWRQLSTAAARLQDRMTTQREARYILDRIAADLSCVHAGVTWPTETMLERTVQRGAAGLDCDRLSIRMASGTALRPDGRASGLYRVHYGLAVDPSGPSVFVRRTEPLDPTGAPADAGIMDVLSRRVRSVTMDALAADGSVEPATSELSSLPRALRIRLQLTDSTDTPVVIERTMLVGIAGPTVLPTVQTASPPAAVPTVEAAP